MTPELQGEIEHYLSKQTIYFHKFSKELITYLDLIYPLFTLKAQWYMLKNNITEIPKCAYDKCEASVKWNERNVSFDVGCSTNHIKKITSLKNFGTEHPNQNKKQLAKVRRSVQEKYGVSSIAHLDSTQTKRKQTNLKKYGVEEAGSATVVRDKIKQTTLLRYGVEEVFASKEIRDKAKQSMIDRYGVENSLSSPEIRMKINETNLERYGSIFPMRNEKLQHKRMNTMLETYGGYSHLSDPTNMINHKFKIMYAYYNDKLLKNDAIKPLFSFEEYSGTLDEKNKGISYRWQCKKCNTIFDDYLAAGHLPSCTSCFPRIWNRSKGEIDLFEYLDVNNKIANDRSTIGKEIDIFLPDFSLGIEFNGMYWHSEQKGKDKYYHFNKTVDSENNGIRLIQVYDKEWYEKKEVVLSHINRFIGKSKIINSSDLDIIEISKPLFNNFIKINSFIDVDHFSKLVFGAYYNNELIAVVNFSNINSNECELRKFVIKNGFDIAGNILKKIIDDKIHNKIVYYFQDRRYNSYIDVDKIIQNGFEFQGVTEPSDYYFKNNVFMSSSHIFKNIDTYIVDYDNALTINENLEINGFLKIWDCGKLVFKSI